RPGSDGGRGPLPQRPVLPAERVPAVAAAAARAPGRHTAPGATLHPALRPAHGAADRDDPAEVMDALVHYPWQGNIRELQNIVERAVILSPGPSLQVP